MKLTGRLAYIQRSSIEPRIPHGVRVALCSVARWTSSGNADARQMFLRNWHWSSSFRGWDSSLWWHAHCFGTLMDGTLMDGTLMDSARHVPGTCEPALDKGMHCLIILQRVPLRRAGYR